MKNTILRFLSIGLIILAVLTTITACSTSTYYVGQSPGQNAAANSDATQDLKKFSSATELREFLMQSAMTNSYSGYLGGSRSFGGVMMKTSAMEESTAPSASFDMADGAASSPSPSDGGADDFSQTNIQVEGVDEADFVKNDNKYIYMVSQGKLLIIDAFPAEDAKILSETKIDGNAVELFVNDNRLAVFTQADEEVYKISEYDFVPRPTYSQRTHVFVYDISDRRNPEIVSDYNIDGSYYNSRMIGNYVYFISRNYIYNYMADMPVIRESSKALFRPDVFYFDNPADNYVFHTIASFDIFDENSINAKTFMLGGSSNLYVSENNIYIAYEKNLPFRYYQSYSEDRFYDAVLPVLPDDAQDEINVIADDDGINSYEKWSRISGVLEEMYNGMNEDAKQELTQEIQDAVEKYDMKIEQERRKTVIHKIGINDGEITYETKGEVSGYLLNQFSMDENGEYFRVATTTYIYTQVSSMYNNVYVLNDDLDVVGSLEDIAPDEQIYSTRFIGDRLYMVTFKRVDPFFVIDLSNPEKPEILGKLKIPGYSDYLHPYDENHVIGIGKDTDSNEWGGVSTGGVKIALFDVSDVENPMQIDSYVIGEPGTDSEALSDHRAFLFDREKGILVIPIRENRNRFYDGQFGYYRWRVWQGAYVFGIDLEGISLNGKITHSEDETADEYYYWSPNAVRRSLFMDDVLYTVSMAKIKMNDMNDVSDEINDINLPYDRSQNYYPYLY
ncbi:MAG: beta-propeller domain-containing protein [Candidatus Woesearchaeota archaeon]